MHVVKAGGGFLSQLEKKRDLYHKQEKKEKKECCKTSAQMEGKKIKRQKNGGVRVWSRGLTSGWSWRSLQLISRPAASTMSSWPARRCGTPSAPSTAAAAAPPPTHARAAAPRVERHRELGDPQRLREQAVDERKKARGGRATTAIGAAGAEVAACRSWREGGGADQTPQAKPPICGRYAKSAGGWVMLASAQASGHACAARAGPAQTRGGGGVAASAARRVRWSVFARATTP